MDELSPEERKLMDQLQAAANGDGPSHAKMILHEGMERWQKAIASSIASVQGMNPGLARRQASQEQAAAAQQVMAEVAKARIEEVAVARKQYMDFLVGLKAARAPIKPGDMTIGLLLGATTAGQLWSLAGACVVLLSLAFAVGRWVRPPSETPPSATLRVGDGAVGDKDGNVSALPARHLSGLQKTSLVSALSKLGTLGTGDWLAFGSSHSDESANYVTEFTDALHEAGAKNIDTVPDWACGNARGVIFFVQEHPHVSDRCAAVAEAMRSAGVAAKIAPSGSHSWSAL